jgi:hypothetical protein
MAQPSSAFIPDGSKASDAQTNAAPRRRRTGRESSAGSLTLTPADTEMQILRAATVFNGDESVEAYALKAALERARADQELFKRTRRPSHAAGDRGTSKARS